MHDMLQNMYQKHDNVKAEDPEITALLAKAHDVFSVVRNMDWLEWGSKLMPKMQKVLAEGEWQAKIECWVHDHAERSQLFKD